MATVEISLTDNNQEVAERPRSIGAILVNKEKFSYPEHLVNEYSIIHRIVDTRDRIRRWIWSSERSSRLPWSCNQMQMREGSSLRREPFQAFMIRNR
jgi:hypothetical protein